MVRLPRSVLACALLLLPALSTACGDDGGTVEDTDSVTGTTGTSTPDGYPEGPYGADVGETIPNLVWRGYASLDGEGPANEEPYGDWSLDDARRSGKRYALLHFGAVF